MNEKKVIVFSSIFLIFVIGGIILSLVGTPSKAVEDVEETTREEVNEEEEVAYMEFVSSTEYFTNSPAQVIIRLLDNQRQPITTMCKASVLYPDKSILFQDQVMIQDPYQNYYYQFLTPASPVGVYTQIANCTYKGRDIISAKTFHIGNATFYLAEKQDTTHTVVEATHNNTILILNALNCTDPTYTAICDQLGLIVNITENINTSIGDINLTCEGCDDATQLYYDINTTDCIVGSYWWFNARVTTELDLVLPYLDCNIITNKWGNATVPFLNDTRYYHYEHQCDSEGAITWDFECERQ